MEIKKARWPEDSTVETCAILAYYQSSEIPYVPSLVSTFSSLRIENLIELNDFLFQMKAKLVCPTSFYLSLLKHCRSAPITITVHRDTLTAT